MCTQVIVPELFELARLSYVPITTLILQDNKNVTDEVVHVSHWVRSKQFLVYTE